MFCCRKKRRLNFPFADYNSREGPKGGPLQSLYIPSHPHSYSHAMNELMRMLSNFTWLAFFPSFQPSLYPSNPTLVLPHTFGQLALSRFICLLTLSLTSMDHHRTPHYIHPLILKPSFLTSQHPFQYPLLFSIGNNYCYGTLFER